MASVITVVSILGVMLGVAVVIIVRSVMTGFGDIWEEKILDFKPHVSLVPMQGNVISGEDEIAKRLRTIPGVTCVTPEIDTRVLLSCRGRVLAPVLLGVDGDEFTRAYKIGTPRAGTFDLDGDSIVLGATAARNLGVWVGDEVVVYSPKTLVAQDEVFLPVKWNVSGIFSCGQHEYDSGYAVASLANVRDLMGMEKGVFAIHVKSDCPTDPEKFSKIVDECVKPQTANLKPQTDDFIYRHKTADLFIAAAAMGGLAGGGSDADVAALREFALNLGLAFQYEDDLLDGDGIYPPDETERLVHETTAAAVAALDQLPCDTTFLRELAHKLIGRKV